jgi:Protein of unknown function (DUF3485)
MEASMFQKLTMLASLGLILAAGTVYGIRVERWGASPELVAATARLSRVPTVVGDWVGSDFEQTDAARLIENGTITGMVSRQYRNRKTGESVALMVVCGKPGPIATHTPEICYGNRGYVAAASPERLSVTNGAASGPAELWLGHFKRTKDAVPESLLISWTWRAAVAGNWTAVDNPRVTFAPYRALYKIYIVRQASPEDPRPDQKQCIDFLNVLLPTLESSLFVSIGSEESPLALDSLLLVNQVQ